MIVQGNLDAFGGMYFITYIRLIVKDQLAARSAIQPAIDSLLRIRRDVLKIAVQRELAVFDPRADEIPAVARVRRLIGNLVVFHVIPARFRVRAVIAAVLACMDSAVRKSVHSFLLSAFPRLCSAALSSIIEA